MGEPASGPGPRRARRLRRRWAAAWLSALVGAVAAGPAWALCPNCLGQNRSLTPTLELLGLFLLVPFLVAYVVLRTIRRACRPDGAARAPLDRRPA